MKHRPTEIREVAKLLDQEWDDVEVLAVAVLDKLMDIKWGRFPWIAIQRLNTETQPDFVAWGPYPTRKQAELDIGRRIVASTPGEYAYFCQVRNKDVTEGPNPETWEE